MTTSQQTADVALAIWQALRSAGLTPEERIEELMASFFAPPLPCDVEYASIERIVIEEMANG